MSYTFKQGQKIEWRDEVGQADIFEIEGIDSDGLARLKFVSGVHTDLWTPGQQVLGRYNLNKYQYNGKSLITLVKVRRTARKDGRNVLFLAASRYGMTFKGLANQVNARKIDTFGVNATQALSRYEDRFGKKLDPKEAVVFKLVPYLVRIDKKNGRMRIGRQIKSA